MEYKTLKRKELEGLCKRDGIQGYSSCKNRGDLIILLEYHKTVKDLAESIKTLPFWYKIPEIKFSKFVFLIKDLYDILEDKKTYESIEDESYFTIQQALYGKTKEEIREERRVIQKDRAFTMALGRLHQSILGNLPGWKDLKVGHTSGCDIEKEDGTSYAEVKNNSNTMNSNGKKQNKTNLMKHKKLGKRVYTIIVNGNIKRKEDSDGIIEISAKEFCKEVTGRCDFTSDLNNTFKELFTRFKTYDSFIESL
jgi:hypothetical protein